MEYQLNNYFAQHSERPKWTNAEESLQVLVFIMFQLYSCVIDYNILLPEMIYVSNLRLCSIF